MLYDEGKIWIVEAKDRNVAVQAAYLGGLGTAGGVKLSDQLPEGGYPYPIDDQEMVRGYPATSSVLRGLHRVTELRYPVGPVTPEDASQILRGPEHSSNQAA